MGRATQMGGGAVLVFATTQSRSIPTVWWVLAWVAIGLGAALFFSRFLPQRQPQLSNGELARQAEALSQAIFQFLADRKRLEPLHRFSTAKTEAGKLRQHQQSVDAHLAHTSETMAQYDQRFASDAIHLYRELLARGCSYQPADENSFEHPTNPLGVRGVAQALGVMAAQLRATLR